MFQCAAEPWWVFKASAEEMAKEYHVYFFIADGHDELGTEFVSLEKYAKDAAEYLRAQGIGRVDAMYGVSMGGAAVIRFLLNLSISQRLLNRLLLAGAGKVLRPGGKGAEARRLLHDLQRVGRHGRRKPEVREDHRRHEKPHGRGDRSSAEGCGLFGSHERSSSVQAVDHGVSEEIRKYAFNCISCNRILRGDGYDADILRGVYSG